MYGSQKVKTYSCALDPAFGFKQLNLTLTVPDFPDSWVYSRFTEHVYDRAMGVQSNTIICVIAGGVVVSTDLGRTWRHHSLPDVKDERIRHVFTCDDGSHLLQTFEPYKAADRVTIYRFDADWKLTDVSQAGSASWHGSRSIDQGRDGVILYAEYPGNTAKYFGPEMAATFSELRDACVYGSTDGGKTWQERFRMSHQDIRHFHTLVADPFQPEHWWLSSGDRSTECRVWLSADNGYSWKEVSSDNITMADVPAGLGPSAMPQVYRHTDVVITPNYLIWGCDDWLGMDAKDLEQGAGLKGGAKVFISPKQAALAPSQCGHVGNPVRSIIDVGPAYLMLTEAYHQNLLKGPQVILMSKAAPFICQEVLTLDCFAEGGTAFTASFASKAAVNGRFFTCRGKSDVFEDGPLILQWDLEFSMADTLVAAEVKAPRDETELVADLQSAQKAKDFDLMIDIAAECRQRFPDQLAGYEIGVIALRDSGRRVAAEQLAAESAVRFPTRPWFLVNVAHLSLRRHDADKCISAARQLRQGFPKDPRGYEYGVRGYRAKGDLQEARGILEEAKRSFAQEAWITKLDLSQSVSEKDWDSAVKQAQALRQAAPADPFGYEAGVSALCQLMATDAARVLLDEGRSKFPDDAALKALSSNFAGFEDWERKDAELLVVSETEGSSIEASLAYALHSSPIIKAHFGGDRVRKQRLEALHAKFPQSMDVSGKLIAEFVEQGLLEEAEQVFDTIKEEVSRSEPIALTWVSLAQLANDVRGATERAESITDWFPESLKARDMCVRMALALVKQDRNERRRAEQICEDAMSRFPDHQPFYDLYGQLAQEAGDLRQAVERWESAKTRFLGNMHPDCDFSRRIVDAKLELNEDAGSAIARPANSASDMDIMMRSQNLGSTIYGCEFGSVQRYFHAEPLHLLRWASCPLEKLVSAIEEDFAGMQNAGDLTLSIGERGGNAEYDLRSAHYDLRLHTYIKTSEMPMDRALAQTRRRYGFLARRLQEDIDTASREKKPVFIYKYYREHAKWDDVIRLFEAVNRRSKNTLLIVQEADAQNAPQSVRVVQPGLLIGYLRNVGKSPAGDLLTIQYDDWMAICRAAIEIADGSGAQD